MKKKVLALSFIVLTAMSLMAQDLISNEVNKAVRGLASGLPRRLNVNIKEITLAGTNDTTTEFSVKLAIMIEHYATNHDMFNVVRPTRNQIKSNEPSIGIISGTYTVMPNKVEVYLRLNVDDKNINSQRFTIPIAELKDISLLPATSKTQEEAVKQDQAIAVITGTANQITQEDTGKQQPVNPPRTVPNTPAANITPQNIIIQAWFDSQLGNRTFMHREPLELTVMADRNCYFKVIHIDVNNQMKMIFPNSLDTNNYLAANTPRAIFEKTSYMLYGPYGAETLLIAASTERYENIEQEYNTPWAPATADAVRAATMGRRGGQVEPGNNTGTQAGEGEIRFTINILKPHEEYRYGKPENMDDFVNSMRSDTERQRGVFRNNDISGSGYSIVNNVRVSYRIPRDTPDMIEFAYYNLNGISGGRNVRGQTRGSGFTFAFDKPGNITQTIQIVRSGIESKGGVFQGNEQQGAFKASGIEGQYRVSEKVNVTITDKPVLIPNSLIEREVKNYFGGR